MGGGGRSHVSVVGEMAARSYLVWSLAECGSFEEAATLGGEAIRIAEDFDSPIKWGHRARDARQGLRNQRRLLPRDPDALAEARAWDLTLLTTAVMADLGYAYTRSERVADGVTILEQILTLGESSQMRASQSRTVVTLGEMSLAADRPDEAAALATRALALTREYGQRGWEASALRLLAEIASRRRPADVAMATTYYRAALATAEDLGMSPLVARCRLGLGSLHQTSIRPSRRFSGTPSGS